MQAARLFSEQITQITHRLAQIPTIESVKISFQSE